MTVAELIAFLQTQPQELQVAHRMYSEFNLLKADDIRVEKLGIARPDGWVPYARQGGSQTYLVFPGN